MDDAQTKVFCSVKTRLTPQPKEGGNYYKFPTADDFARFRREAGDIVTARDYADILSLAYADRPPQ